MALRGEAKKAYQRELMRKRREEAKKVVEEAIEGVDPRLPWPLNPTKAPRWGEGVPVYIAPTLEEKEAMAEREEAKMRAARELRKKLDGA